MSALDPLLEAIRQSRDAPEDWTCLGSVTDNSPLTVMVDGEESSSGPYTRLDAYTPTVGDRVLMLRVSTSLVVLGRVV